MRISYWSSDVCSSDLRPPWKRFGSQEIIRRVFRVSRLFPAYPLRKTENADGIYDDDDDIDLRQARHRTLPLGCSLKSHLSDLNGLSSFLCGIGDKAGQNIQCGDERGEHVGIGN